LQLSIRVFRDGSAVAVSMTLGILFALACSLVTNLGFLCKHRGACAAAAVDVRRPLRSLRALLRSGWFALGMAVAGGAWVFHAAALAFAPLSIVQVVLAGGVVLLAVMAERLFGCAVGARQRVCLGLTAAGLVLIVATLPATPDGQAGFSPAGLLAFQATLLVVAGSLIAASCAGLGREHAGVMLGAAAGTLFAVSNVALKALIGLVAEDGVAALIAPWLLVALTASVVAFYASARSLQQGEAVPVIALTGTAANVANIAGGFIVFGDPVPADSVAIVALMLGFASVCMAALLTPAPLRVAPATA
jgi:hypothetical protein